jgi:hypothetical protein
MEEILTRVWENLIGRNDGPLTLRLFMQPTVAAIFAVRAGLRDARNGKPAFLWTVLTSPEHRHDLIHEGWKDIGKLLIMTMILDAVYQLIVHRGVYVFELLTAVTVLAIIPYAIVRGPVNRIARFFSRGTSEVPNTSGDVSVEAIPENADSPKG